MRLLNEESLSEFYSLYCGALNPEIVEHVHLKEAIMSESIDLETGLIQVQHIYPVIIHLHDTADIAERDLDL